MTSKAINEPSNPVNGLAAKGPKASQSSPAMASIDDANRTTGGSHQDLERRLDGLEIWILLSLSILLHSLDGWLPKAVAFLILINVWLISLRPLPRWWMAFATAIREIKMSMKKPMP